MSKTVKTVLKVLGYKTYELWNVKMVSKSLSMPVRCCSL